MPNVQDHDLIPFDRTKDNVRKAPDLQPSDIGLVGHLRRVGEVRQLTDRFLNLQRPSLRPQYCSER
jgi:hypothetical protein